MSSVSRSRHACALAAALALATATAGPAAAAPATITVAASRFTPSAVTVAAGESVTWNFAEPSHNVAGDGWSGNNGFGRGTFARTFDTPGTFAFVCQAHPGSMKGSVTVTAAAAAPPQDLATPGAAVGAVGGALADTAPGATWLFPAAPDRVAPRLDGLRLMHGAHRRRPLLRANLSEDAMIVVELRRAGAHRVAVRHAGTRGPNSLALAARPGRYILRVVAVDAAGNESSVRHATMRVRGS